MALPSPFSPFILSTYDGQMAGKVAGSLQEFDYLLKRGRRQSQLPLGPFGDPYPKISNEIFGLTESLVVTVTVAEKAPTPGGVNTRSKFVLLCLWTIESGTLLTENAAASPPEMTTAFFCGRSMGACPRLKRVNSSA